jgi:hypothetical protein
MRTLVKRRQVSACGLTTVAMAGLTYHGLTSGDDIFEALP